MSQNNPAAGTMKDIENLTSLAIQSMSAAQRNLEELAEERNRQKLSSSRVAAIVKELKQLMIVLGGYEYRHPADNL